MSKTTANFGLIKPELTDAADITNTNANWDIIDEQLKNNGDRLDDLGANLLSHEHFHNGLSSLVKYCNTPGVYDGSTSYVTITPNKVSGLRHYLSSTGLWVVSANTEFLDIYMPNNNIDGDTTQNRYLKGLKPPILLMVNELSNERIQVIEVINGNVITSKVGNDGTTYNHTVGNIATNGYTYGTNDLEAGVNPLETGKMYFVYE